MAYVNAADIEDKPPKETISKIAGIAAQIEDIISECVQDSHLIDYLYEQFGQDTKLEQLQEASHKIAQAKDWESANNELEYAKNALITLYSAILPYAAAAQVINNTIYIYTCNISKSPSLNSKKAKNIVKSPL